LFFARRKAVLKPIETPKAPKPFSNYSQAVEVAPSARYLFVAGQVGATLEGDIPGDPARQHELAWANVLAILEAAGMDHRNIVDAHVYITSRDQVGLYREIRDRVLKGHKPAATLLIVTGLADPRLVVEVGVVAAAPAT
jgi:2-iminobutanoate/2-iminopropanoate deaminase